MRKSRRAEIDKPSKEIVEAPKVNEAKYVIKRDEFKHLCKIKHKSQMELSFKIEKSNSFLSTAMTNGIKVDLESLNRIARELKCKISDIAEIPEENDIDYTPPVRIHVAAFALNCSELLSPVEIVKANPVQTSDFAHWVSLPETPNPHIEHKIDGVVAFRYENGNSILFANEYVNPIHFPMAMEQIRKWGESESIRNTK